MPTAVDTVFDGAAVSIDGLVNNAGLLVSRKTHDQIPLDEWDRMFAVNVKGTFLCARAAVRAMNDGGSIVNVASETAFTGSHGFVHYVASKGAVVSLTRALANELGGRGIRVNCVAPGFTPTPGSDVLGTYDPSRTPLGRVMAAGRPARHVLLPAVGRLVVRVGSDDPRQRRTGAALSEPSAGAPMDDYTISTPPPWVSSFGAAT